MRKFTRWLTVAAAVIAVPFALAGPVMAHDHFGTHLSSVQEVPAVFTDGHGFALVTLNDAGTAFTYSLVYFEMGSPVAQAHIHFGQEGVNGGIMVFLCTNLGNGPTGTQACPSGVGDGIASVSGTITAADVGAGAAAQGVGAGNFAGLVEAVESGRAYVNVHTANFPGGEIRGQLAH
jgi:hypothetical protein